MPHLSLSSLKVLQTATLYRGARNRITVRSLRMGQGRGGRWRITSLAFDRASRECHLSSASMPARIQVEKQPAWHVALRASTALPAVSPAWTRYRSSSKCQDTQLGQHQLDFGRRKPELRRQCDLCLMSGCTSAALLPPSVVVSLTQTCRWHSGCRASLCDARQEFVELHR